MMVSHLKIQVGTPKLSPMILIASALTPLGLVFGAENEYQPRTAVWLRFKLPPSGRPVPDASGFWRVNNQERLAPTSPVFSGTLNQPQQQNWSPDAAEADLREDLNWVVPQRSVSFGHIENLSQQAPYQEAFTQTSPSGSKPYMHDIPSGDPNALPYQAQPLCPLTLGSYLPSSASQPWQSVSQYGYMKTSAAPAGEGLNSWFPTIPTCL
jgi:hypothetical protein